MSPDLIYALRELALAFDRVRQLEDSIEEPTLVKRLEYSNAVLLQAMALERVVNLFKQQEDSTHAHS